MREAVKTRAEAAAHVLGTLPATLVAMCSSDAALYPKKRA